MTLPETRLTVTLLSATKPFKCCVEQFLEVSCEWHRLTDEECCHLVKVCGFNGQEVAVKSRNEAGHTFKATVRVFCDSGD